MGGALVVYFAIIGLGALRGDYTTSWRLSIALARDSTSSARIRGRPLVYPRAWLLLQWSPITRENTVAVGVLIAGSFFCSVFVFLGRIPRGRALLGAALLAVDHDAVWLIVVVSSWEEVFAARGTHVSKIPRSYGALVLRGAVIGHLRELGWEILALAAKTALAAFVITLWLSSTRSWRARFCTWRCSPTASTCCC